MTTTSTPGATPVAKPRTPTDLGVGIALTILSSPALYGASASKGMCQNFARRYFEVRYKLASGGFYTLFGGVSGTPSAVKCLRAIQARRPGWIVPYRDRQPGDLAYWAVCGPGDTFGHVAVLQDRNANGRFEYAQNTTYTSGVIEQHQGYLRLSDASVQDAALGQPIIVRVPNPNRVK